MAANIQKRGKSESLGRHLSIRPRFLFCLSAHPPTRYLLSPSCRAKAAPSHLSESRSHAALSSHLTGMKALITSDSAPAHGGGH